jgi:RHS repeat-associated protein
MNESCSRYFDYSYDGVGNRLSQTTENGTTTYTYDAADELTSETTGSDTTDYAYDLNGNETQAGSTQYAYNLANELIQQTKGESEVSYTYTGDGLTASRTGPSGTTNYAWDSNFDLPQLAIEGSNSYTYGVEPLGFVTPGGTYTYHTDLLGSVVELSNSSGTSVESYRYSPYGEADSGGDDPEADSALGNSLRYAGQYLDSETDLYDMRAREYDPGTGRFLEIDPMEAEVGDPSVGVYVYVDDQPTVEVDPSGMCVPKGDSLRSPCMTPAKPIGGKAVAIALADVGKKEKNSVCPWKDWRTGKVIGHLHPDPGFTRWFYGSDVCAPWCAIAVTKWFVEAGSKVFQRGAKWENVGTMSTAALNGTSGMQVVEGTPRPGDIVAYDLDYGVAAPDDDTGIIVSASSRSSFNTIEGNTSRQGAGGTGEGSNRDGVWRKHRNLPEGKGFNTAVFIRITK